MHKHKSISNLNYWFTYVCKENAYQYSSDIEKLIKQKCLLDGISLSRIFYGPARKRCLKYLFKYITFRLSNKTVLFKDPLAFFAAPWLKERFGFRVIVLIRNPLAFAASLKSRNWLHPFEHFSRQPFLLRSYLNDYSEDIERILMTEHDVIDHSILLWRIIYGTANQYRKQNLGFIYKRHEDMVRNPLGEYKSLFDDLGLRITKPIENEIKHLACITSKENSLIGDSRVRRISVSQLNKWKTILTPDEVTRIQEGVADVMSCFYKDSKWT